MIPSNDRNRLNRGISVDLKKPGIMKVLDLRVLHNDSLALKNTSFICYFNFNVEFVIAAWLAHPNLK
ncbi:hypothetical protein BH11BAC5_BH11BAC5_45930 [soil metagenome]